MRREFLVFSLALLASISTAKADILTWNVGSSIATDVVATLNTVDSTLTVSGTGTMQNYGTSYVKVPYSSYRNRIKTLVVEEGVTSLGDSAVARCPNLVSVSFPSTLTRLGSYAFAHCTGLTSVNLSENLNTFDVGVFNACYALQNIEVASENSKYSSENGVLFNKNKTTLLQYPAGRQGAYNIPEGVTVIGSDAFWSCYLLTGITMPNTLQTIGTYSFYSCTRLGAVVIPNSVKTIDFWAFAYCTALKSIDIPNSVNIVGYRAFAYCFSLASAHIGSGINSWGSAVFYSCISLLSIDVDSNSGLLASEEGVLFGKNKDVLLQYPAGRQGAYIIPNSVIRIFNYAFGNCLLNSVTLPKNLTTIDSNSFIECINLTSVYNRAFTPQSIFSDFTNRQNCTLYVPFGSVPAYQNAYVWKEFAVVKEDVNITATDNSAVVECLTSYGGTTNYKLLIYTDEAKTQNLTTYNIPAANVQNDAFTQTVENLQAETKYWFDIQALSSRGAPLGSFSGNFTTESASGIAGVLSGKIAVFVANGQLNIQTDELKIKNVTIYDLTGKIILNSQFSTLNSMNVSTFAAGVYLLKIETGKGVITKKFRVHGNL